MLQRLFNKYNFLPKSIGKLVIGATIALVLFQAVSSCAVYIIAPRTTPHNFAAWCEQQFELPLATRHTIEALLHQAETKDCQEAETKLSKIENFGCSGCDILDLRPLQSLPPLRWLQLENSQISDLKPLQFFTNLNYLSLERNQISDLRPLQSLTKSESVELSSELVMPKVYWFAQPASLLPHAVLPVNL